jgi:4-aminobutyrate aminotransferase-like enzyme
VPDIATMGKPMGNGHPIAGVVASEELITRLVSELYYFNTFGGNPVSCAVGMAVLDVLEEENLMENARQVGEYLRGGLRELQKEHEWIGDVRGRGLFNAVELVRDRASKEAAGAETRKLMNAMRQRGVLLGLDGRKGNVLKLRPPMPFSRENADQLVETLGAALGDL